MYGHQDGGGVGGYQPAAPAYPVAGAAPAVGGGGAGVAGMTQQFSQMDMSQKPAPQAAPQRGPVLNQLYPTDLLNQPFNVQELDYPPPLAILPPNVSVEDNSVSKNLS
jgi:protein transport protein SEC24